MAVSCVSQIHYINDKNSYIYCFYALSNPINIMIKIQLTHTKGT